MVLAVFGFVICAALAVVSWVLDVPALAAVLLGLAVVAVIDLGRVIARKRCEETG